MSTTNYIHHLYVLFPAGYLALAQDLAVQVLPGGEAERLNFSNRYTDTNTTTWYGGNCLITEAQRDVFEVGAIYLPSLLLYYRIDNQWADQVPINPHDTEEGYRAPTTELRASNDSGATVGEHWSLSDTLSRLGLQAVVQEDIAP